MPDDLVARIRLLRWFCVDCKRCCLCQLSKEPVPLQSGSDVTQLLAGSTDASSDRDLLLCDSCDRGFHMFCLEPRMSELPEGNWICPICTPRVGSKEGSFTSLDPRLDAIRVCDQLTQHEIDWMQQELNASGKSSPDTRSPSSVDSSARKTVRPRTVRNSRLSLLSSSSPRMALSTTPSTVLASLSSKAEEPPDGQTELYDNSPLAPKIDPTSQSNAPKPKRLVQKSLTSWAVTQSREEPAASLSIKTESLEQRVETKGTCLLCPFAVRKSDLALFPNLIHQSRCFTYSFHLKLVITSE
ncbi:unnamed protein product [Echinostoma caproni]|uniref:PHD-type domain-containing protein n=1 Tax=Echinostoma caproni TaxID=27848 RepID=A0A183BF75_9TREM|nr:unnamed protein product [Echinostoma caproni]